MSLTFEMIDAIAKVTHEANRALCETLGDMSQTSWDMAPDWQKNSARNGVLFHFSNPDAEPSSSHENWMKQKLAEGWTYGEEKDTDNKRHPCLIPFENLPPAQKVKDFIFRGICHAMVQGYGLK